MLIPIAALFALPFLQLPPGLGPDVCMDPSYDISEFCPLDRGGEIPSLEEFQRRQDVQELYLDPDSKIPPSEEILRNHVIAGDWRLDQDASDSIPAIIYRQTGKGIGQGTGALGDGGKTHETESDGWNESYPGDLPGLEEFTAATVRIEQTGARIILHYPDSGERILYTDGRGMVTTPAPTGMTAVQRAFVTAWGGQDRLVVETAANGMRLYESYSLSPDGEKLQLSITLKSNRLAEPVKADLVYNRENRTGPAEK